MDTLYIRKEGLPITRPDLKAWLSQLAAALEAADRHGERGIEIIHMSHELAEQIAADAREYARDL